MTAAGPSAPFGVPADPVRSPATGLTRAHWERAADVMLRAARPFAAPGNSLITFPGEPGGYGSRVDGLEGFARTFLMAAFRLAGAGGADPDNLAEWYAQGLSNGTDPAHPHRWIRTGEDQQAKVEIASVALGLHLTRPWLWDRLTESVREAVIDYMAEVTGTEYPLNNWLWFQVVTQTFLREAGGPWSEADIDAALARLESYDAGGGWYADGPKRAFDHYNGWALHFYPFLWAMMAPHDPRAVAMRRRAESRLRLFLADAIHLIGADGAPLIQGRSLTYRFAAAAPLWMDALSGCGSLPPGQVRRAASGILRYFLDHGAPDADGLLRIGWHAPWRPIAQSYSGPGSPYWASKGLLGLLLPPDHAVWTATEEPLPVERADFHRVIEAPGWLVTGSAADGSVHVVNHGTDHARPGWLGADSPLYCRVDYSTTAAPAMTTTAWSDPLDGTVALLDETGRASYRRGFSTLDLRQSGEWLIGASRARVHWLEPYLGPKNHGMGNEADEGLRLGPWLTIASFVNGGRELRAAVIDAADDATVPTGRIRFAGSPQQSGDRARLASLAGLANEIAHTSVSAQVPLAGDWTVPWTATTAAAQPGVVYAVLLTHHPERADRHEPWGRIEVDLRGGGCTRELILRIGAESVTASVPAPPQRTTDLAANEGEQLCIAPAASAAEQPRGSSPQRSS